jgi:hypothetical protein
MLVHPLLAVKREMSVEGGKIPAPIVGRNLVIITDMPINFE